MSLLALPGLIALLLSFAMLLSAAFAFIDATTHRPDAYVAGDKLTKKAWLIILGLALASQMLFFGNPLSLLNLVAIVAALVYLLDVRPTLRSLTRR